MALGENEGMSTTMLVSPTGGNINTGYAYPAPVYALGNQNGGAEIFIAVPSLCGCESISVRNTSTQAIDVQNANLTVDYIGVRRAL